MTNSSLAAFPKILAMSQQMAELAIAEDWEALVTIERARAALVATLPDRPLGLPSNEARQVAGIIGEIMVHDATVREHVEPWLEHVKILFPASASQPDS